MTAEAMSRCVGEKKLVVSVYTEKDKQARQLTGSNTNSRRCWCRSRWLLRLRTGSHFSPASLPAPDPVVHVSAWGAVADARLGLA